MSKTKCNCGGRISTESLRGFRDGYEGLRPAHGTARYLAGWRAGRRADAVRRSLYGLDPTRFVGGGAR